MKIKVGMFVALVLVQPVVFFALLMACVFVFSPSSYPPSDGVCGEDDVGANGLCHGRWELSETLASLITASAGVCVFDTAAIVLIVRRRRRQPRDVSEQPQASDNPPQDAA